MRAAGVVGAGGPARWNRWSRLILALTCCSCLLLANTAQASDGDFAFDSSEESKQWDMSHKIPQEQDCPVRRLWGVPDMSAYVGQVLHLRIQKEAFSGKISSYKISGVERPLPKWLTMDSRKGVLYGVPLAEDKGEHRLLITAVSLDHKTHCSPATDVFTIEVKDKKEAPIITSSEEQCHMGENESRLVLLVGTPLHKISPKQRLQALTKLADFMDLDKSVFTIQPHEMSSDTIKERGSARLLGNTKEKHFKAATEIKLTVGCSGVLWPKHSILVHQIKEQVRDNSISDIIQLPVIGWRLVDHKQAPVMRPRRDTYEGSTFDDAEDLDDSDNAEGMDDEDYSGYDEDDYNNGSEGEETKAEEEDKKEVVEEEAVSSTPFLSFNTPSRNAQENATEKTRQTSEDDFNRSVFPKSDDAVTSTTPISKYSFIPDNTDDYIVDEDDEINTVSSSDWSTLSSAGAPRGSSARDTTPTDPGTTESSSTIIGKTTETIYFPSITMPVNSPPQKQHRNKKVPVTAGKAFSYIIPEDLFIDNEDGTNLQLAMYDAEHVPLKSSSWVQFDPQTREVYGLPLEEHVSKWEYIVEATDSQGANVTDKLDIMVQQHKGRRSVNHEFSLKLRILKEYSAVVDWQIRILKGLVNLFRDTDMDQITVRKVDLEADPIEFIWTNDTLPKNFCPQSDIDRLMGILQSNVEGDPSQALRSVMSPELRVMSVSWQGTNQCQRAPPTPPAAAPPPHQPDNYGPMPRNQIDHINATAGQLLVFKVPEDTFYDPEDGNSRNLKMWLTRGDRSAIPPQNWLQFDSKNQEFYGLPLERDIGRKDYQLICEDKGGSTANDGLLVEVHPGIIVKPTVEFSMTLEMSYEKFMQSANMKRKFVEKLYTLFNDKDASAIKIKSITDRPTVITWYNTSLPTDKCSQDEIRQLKKVLVMDDGSLTGRVDVIMGADFPVMSVGFNTKGVCFAGPAIVRVPEINTKQAAPSDDASKTITSDDYLITFIVPIIVIVVMILLASLIACYLYRRRRTGKMSVGDDEERQAFRSKGIPVIFQDELDEKPDPSNKSPVIMKEEKPPLLPPPEYKGSIVKRRP